MYDNSSKVIEIDINEILPNRFQPRIQFDEEEILELSDSIKEHGVIQPIVVRTIGDKYEIIAGERRYKASVLAGRETVPVIVKNLNDKDSAEIALIENIQRKNLTPIEEALSYKKILDMGYLTQENLASKLGKSQSAVANKIRLLNLSDEVQEALLENKISERHARSLLKLSTSKLQNEMLNRIVTERLTVRKADEEIEKLKNNISDEDNSDEQKIIEKGEINMNNNMFGIPNIPQNEQPSTPSFDIFGAPNQQSVEPQQPMVNPVQEVVQSTPNFDIFAGTTPVQPEIPTIASAPEIPVANSIPEVQPISTPEVPVMPEMPTIGGMKFDSNLTAVGQPQIPQQPEIPTITSVPETPIVNPIPEIQPISTPEVPVIPEIPTMSGIEFDSNGTVVSAPQTIQQPEVPVMSEMPSMNNIPAVPNIEPIVPQTAPIMESSVVDTNSQMTQQSEDLFSFGDNNLNSMEQPQQAETTIPEFKMPEPIIVTDYSKQYDPVMPQTFENMTPTVDFKEVINAIRECSNKIEQYGFKIDVEEYDLANLYQVIFKIEK